MVRISRGFGSGRLWGFIHIQVGAAVLFCRSFGGGGGRGDAISSRVGRGTGDRAGNPRCIRVWAGGAR